MVFNLPSKYVMKITRKQGQELAKDSFSKGEIMNDFLGDTSEEHIAMIVGKFVESLCDSQTYPQAISIVLLDKDLTDLEKVFLLFQMGRHQMENDPDLITRKLAEAMSVLSGQAGGEEVKPKVEEAPSCMFG